MSLVLFLSMILPALQALTKSLIENFLKGDFTPFLQVLVHDTLYAVK